MAWVGHAVVSYAEWLFTSFERLVLMTAIWVIALAGAAWTVADPPLPRPLEAATKAVSWFLGGNTESSADIGLMIVSWCAAIAGAFHVGVLISHLYSLVTRK
jgi:hypothetical protein